MQDTYDEQIEAILANDAKGFTSLMRVDDNHSAYLMFWDRLPLDGLYETAWNVGGLWSGCLFEQLPGSSNCASQIDTEILGHPEDVELHQLFHSTGDMILRTPTSGEVPTREILEEFARRQRLARDLIEAGKEIQESQEGQNG